MRRFFSPAEYLCCLSLAFLPNSKGETNLLKVTELTVQPGAAGFSLVPAELSGIEFTNRVSEQRGATNQIYYSGSGVALGDVDGDGRTDLYLCGLDVDNKLFRNLGGWRFEDRTAAAGVACAGQASTGAVFADVDGDSDLDLLVTSLGNGVRLFLNDSKGGFAEATKAAGLSSQHAGMTLALADIDRDGDLDLYAANYRSSTFQDQVDVQFRLRNEAGQTRIVAVDGRPMTDPDLRYRYYVDERGTIQERGEEDVLYRNDGQGRFSAVSWTDGTFLDQNGEPLDEPPRDWGLAAMFRDMNGDGAVDLYVCNDNESPDRIWMNDGSGKFRALSTLALRETSLASMGIDFADINRDGFDDFFVSDMLGYDHETLHTQMAPLYPVNLSGGSDLRLQFPRNTLFLNRGDNTFAEIAQFSMVEASDWTWSPIFLDVDLDGFEDLLITTGLEKNLRHADARQKIELLRRQKRLTQAEFVEIRRGLGRLDTPNYAFRNRGDLTFENTSKAWNFDSRLSSHGMAMGDLDGDGDLDLAVSCLNAPALLYRNNAGAARVAVRLRGLSPNTQAVGARIEVKGGPVPQSQQIISGGRYLSGDDGLRTFACGQETVLSVRVQWPGGGTTHLQEVRANRLYEISQPGGTTPPPPVADLPSQNDPWFADVSHLLNHQHEDMPYNDFARQPMLTRTFTAGSPGISWGDLDGDGSDDLMIGPGRGGKLAIFASLTNRFERLDIPGLPGNALDDVGSILAWPSGGQTNLLVFSQSHYESEGRAAACVFRMQRTGAEPAQKLEAWEASPGALAAADVDGDGDLDLFVAGRIAPGQYPQPVSSRFYRNNAGQWHFDQKLSEPFQAVGIVHGALFSDLDGDGKSELILSCEWDSLRIFSFTEGRFVEVTARLGLDRYRGRWQGVATGDLDGDGRMDIVVANWGLNHRYRRFVTPQRPLLVYYTDINRDNSFELFEAYYDPGMGKVVPADHWNILSQQMPLLQQSIGSFQEFSRLGTEDIFKGLMNFLTVRTANTFESTVFLNRGSRFEARPLPPEAQFAPAFGVTVADFDGDGAQDVFLSQNFFGTGPGASRHAAGRGLLLLGNGDGTFRPTSSRESGIELYGEGRGSSAGDFNRDGRMDLAVGQHDGETKLYRNRRARPGLLVKLTGPENNEPAAGAVLRPLYSSGQYGPAQEIQLGSGWFSQESLVRIISLPEPVVAIEVRWPGSKTIRTPVPAKARFISIKAEGG